jgi:hypothetical protein
MGKGKVNKSLKAWVAFVKSVQKKYKLNYKDAISKAKVLKDNGADWMSNSFKQSKKMKGGEGDDEEIEGGDDEGEVEEVEEVGKIEGGRRRRRTRKHRSKSRSRSRSRGRAFKRTMSRRKSASRKASRSMGLVMGVA